MNPDYQKWVTKLLGFDFEIQFKPGASNKVADALSRKTAGEVVLNAMISTPVVSWELLEAEIKEDTNIQRIRTELETGEQPHKHFSVVNNRLLYKGRWVIPRNSKVIPTLLFEYHDAAMGGHTGELKTYLRMATSWFWTGMRQDVKL